MMSINRDKYLILVNAIGISMAFTIHFPELISLLTPGNDSMIYPNLKWSQVGSEILFNYLSVLIIFIIDKRLFRFTDENYVLGYKKIICLFLLTWLLNSLLGNGFIYLHREFGIPAIEAMAHVYSHPLRDFLLSAIVTLSCFLIHQGIKSRKMMLENQQLKTANLLNQFEALKNQLNPHMLFNSLNTLYSLIRESPDKAQDYLNELSKVMRYTLQQDSDTHSISLKEELEFVRSYVYLLKMRYEENLTFNYNIDNDAMGRHIPKMAIQLLIENAVKHNEISNKHPLEVNLTTGNGYIEVSNRLQLRRGAHNSTGIGLANLSQRYNLLFKKDIEILENGNTFTVRIPLI